MNYPIDAISIGERRREDYGDLASLASSIEHYGLLHPIVIDDEGNLVAGGRRLEAVKLLGWSSVAVTRLGELSDNERRAIELEENLRRKDLTDWERSRNLVERIEVQRAIVAGRSATVSDSDTVAKTKPGPLPNPASIKSIARDLEIPRATIVQAQQHVETADAYPFMQDWPQYRVLEARHRLADLDPAEREQAVDLISEPGTPPDIAVGILANLVNMPATERTKLYTLYASTDEQDRNLAKTRAAGLPPLPDPALLLWQRVHADIRTALKATKDEQIRQSGQAARDAVSQIIQRLEHVYEQRAAG